MTASAETVRKLNSLGETEFVMIVNTIDRLSKETSVPEDVKRFREIRKITSQHPKTEEEVDAIVAETRKELYSDSD